MFYDLNVPWTSASDPQLLRTLHFQRELGYDVVALNHAVTGKLPAEITPPTLPSPSSLPANLTVKTRLTLTLQTGVPPPSNSRLTALAAPYDLLSLRPTDERSLTLACTALDCDIVSLDLTVRHPFWYKHTMLKEALASGKKVELCYAQALSGSGGETARRTVISNATQLIRATRGRGLLLSSEARTAVACRGPADVVNLAAVWGLSQERGREAVGREARSVLVAAALKKRGYRGTVEVISGGDVGEEKGNGQEEKEKGGANGVSGVKRKVENGEVEPAPMSKRQMKRMKKEAKAKAVSDSERDEKTVSEGDIAVPDAPS